MGILSGRKRPRFAQAAQACTDAKRHPVVRAPKILKGFESSLKLMARRTVLVSLGEAFTIHSLGFGMTPAHAWFDGRPQRQRLARLSATGRDMMLRKFNACPREERGGELVRIERFHVRQCSDSGVDFKARTGLIARRGFAERVLDMRGGGFRRRYVRKSGPHFFSQ